MKSLLFALTIILMSCTNVPSQKESPMQEKAELLVSESQGGADQPGFRIIKDEKDFRNTIKMGFGWVDLEKEPATDYPKFPKNKKVVLYNLGNFRSGSHRVTEIRNVSVKNNILYVEIPAGEPSGEMEIQVISNPWIIFAVPAEYQFTSVELKYSK
ncbi:hypothetical protein [Chryseobacterium sp.]|uniref:hypothetical protein n=1 Tax=Chryseobacterium sp. TaxID=1871047 RepID=UPI002898111B|nr:hypothetical protein [Chryseobacterium sp.]